MHKEQIEARLEELKQANLQEQEELRKVEKAKEQLIQNMLTRNGRILELLEVLKQTEDKKE